MHIQAKVVEPWPSPKQIYEDANELARAFYASMGYQVPVGYRFDRATHPHETGCWIQACMAFDALLGIDLDALDPEEE